MASIPRPPPGSRILPPGWTAATDPTSGRTYYYNAATGESNWNFSDIVSSASPSLSLPSSVTQPEVEIPVPPSGSYLGRRKQQVNNNNSSSRMPNPYYSGGQMEEKKDDDDLFDEDLDDFESESDFSNYLQGVLETDDTQMNNRYQEELALAQAQQRGAASANTPPPGPGPGLSAPPPTDPARRNSASRYFAVGASRQPGTAAPPPAYQQSQAQGRAAPATVEIPPARFRPRPVQQRASPAPGQIAPARFALGGGPQPRAAPRPPAYQMPGPAIQIQQGQRNNAYNDRRGVPNNSSSFSPAFDPQLEALSKKLQDLERDDFTALLHEVREELSEESEYTDLDEEDMFEMIFSTFKKLIQRNKDMKVALLTARDKVQEVKWEKKESEKQLRQERKRKIRRLRLKQKEEENLLRQQQQQVLQQVMEEKGKEKAAMQIIQDNLEAQHRQQQELLEQKLEEKDQEMASMQAQQYEDEKRSSQQQQELLQQKMYEKDQEIAAVQQQMEETDQEMAALQQQQVLLQQKVEEKDQQIQTMQAALQESDRKQSEALRAAGQAQSQGQDQATAIEDLQAHLEALEHDLNEATQQLDETQQDNEALQEEMAAQAKTLEETQAELEALKNKAITARIAEAATAAGAGREIIAVMAKKQPGIKLGLHLHGEKGRLLVTEVKEGGLLASSGLSVGMEIFSINNIQVAGKSSDDAAEIIKKIKGELTIIAFAGAPGKAPAAAPAAAPPSKQKAKAPAQAQAAPAKGAKQASDPGASAATAAAAGREIINVRVQKPPGSKVGLTTQEQDGKLVVVKVKEGGLVAGSGLDEGMEIFSINNIHVTEKAKASKIFADTTGALTIVAFGKQKAKAPAQKQAPAPAPRPAAPAKGGKQASGDPAAKAAADGREIITVKVQKPPGSKVGLTTTEEDGKLVVVKVKEGGLVAGSGLEEGMEIFSINNIQVTEKAKASKIFADTTGALTIVAFAAEESSEEESSEEESGSSEEETDDSGDSGGGFGAPGS